MILFRKPVPTPHHHGPSRAGEPDRADPPAARPGKDILKDFGSERS
jgi:hypothetical protein